VIDVLRSFAARQKQNLGQKLLHSWAHPLYLRLTGQPDSVSNYRSYVAAQPDCPESTLDLPHQPRISILLPVHNPKREWLQAAIDSVRKQTYAHWELCICNDASGEPWVDPFIRKAAEDDARVRYSHSAVRLGIAGALNQASELASGAYFTFLDHDDFLSPAALHAIAAELQSGPVDFLYADEDYVDAHARPVLPHLKPDWSPELLSNCMYVGHPMVVSQASFRSLGGFRSEFDGAQDYDLALRIAEIAASPIHIPRILYHWRRHDASVAKSTSAKPLTHGAGKRALDEAIRRRGWRAAVLEDTIPNQYVVRRYPSKGSEHKILVFSDPGLEPRTADWRENIAAQLERPEIGIAGVKILQVDGTIDHCGYALSKDRLPQAPGQGTRGLPYWKWLNFTREVSAVGGGFLAIRRELFNQLGGFDPSFPKLGEIDLCLRVRQLGLKVLFMHDAVFQRTTIDRSVRPEQAECELFRARWNAVLPEADPYYKVLPSGRGITHVSYHGHSL
jgi:GT2 family glycosyltransferase